LDEYETETGTEEYYIMKKKLLAVLMAAAVTLTFTACGSSNAESSEDTESTGQEADDAASTGEGYMKDFNAADYVTLGEYKGIEVALDEPTVTDEELESYISYVLQNSAVSVEVTDRSVEEGDIVNIDYVGKVDDVAFDGGTAEGYDLTIGSGTFIDGFEDGCIGMEIGETKDVEATFPDPYTNNTDLSGKTAVFTVTVNSISVQEIPELTDEYVQSLALEECSNVDEYRAYMSGILMEQKQSTFESDKSDLVYDAVVNACEFKDAPEAMVNRMNNTLITNLTSYADMYGVDIGTFVTYYYGGDAEDYEETLLSQAQVMAQNYLMMQAIADKENLNVSDEELEEQLAEEAESYGYETEEYKEMLDIEAYREYLMAQKVMDFLTENAVTVPTE
jgi:trigger factor